ncbi:hypothetical protein AK812_SmicGene41899 [Symbiodinium microadriaticum]|uniref:Uncharacterized protein n=1 Tax=Symbiodinium microadriaticum TaxID=2951 RepID=A0A1Q9C501_SYMMI|nr:hypothetical protein AK812_SmicGene41899 [Symbiodinium microadriaticum]
MPSVKSMGRLLRWLWLLAVARVHGEDNVDGGDILDAMLGAPPPTPQIPTVAPVIPTTPEPIVSPNKPGCAADITTALYYLTNIARMLTYVTADCAQPGQISTICANDVLTIVILVSNCTGGCGLGGGLYWQTFVFNWYNTY